MLPRWFRLVVAAEIAAAVVAAVLLIRLVTGGVQAAGGVVSWARNQAASTPAPVASTLPPVATAPPRPAEVLPPGLGSLLNRGTGGEYVGEWALVQLFETVLREQATTLLGTSASAPPRP